MQEKTASKSWLQKVIPMIDILAPEVKFNIGGQTCLKTAPGGILTVMFLICVAFLSTFTVRNYFRTDNPITMSQTWHSTTYPKINLAEQNIVAVLFAFVNDTIPLTFEESLNYVSFYSSRQAWVAQEVDGKFTSVYQDTQFSMKACGDLSQEKRARLKYIGENGYLGENLKSYGICIDFSEADFYVQGKGSDDIFEYLTIQIKPCSLGVDRCVQPERVKDISFLFVTPKVSFRAGDYENPIQTIPDADYNYYLSPSVMQNFYIDLKMNTVNDYLGFIPKWTTRGERFFDISKTFSNVQDRVSSQTSCDASIINHEFECEPYLYFILQSGGTVLNYNRRYKSHHFLRLLPQSQCGF